MSLPIRPAITVVLAALAISLFSQRQDIVFKRITEGFTNCLLKDSDGYIWLGTQDGLIRYDGHQFRTFRNARGDTSSISNNYILCLLQDQNDRIWIGTFGGGLVMWDKHLEVFRTFHPSAPSVETVKANSIRSLTVEGDILWVGSEDGLYPFDLTTMTFADRRTVPAQLTTGFIHALASTLESTLMIGSETGLFHWDKKSAAATRMPFVDDTSTAVLSLLLHNEELYVGAISGLYKAQAPYQAFFPYYESRENLAGAVYDIQIAGEIDIWIATHRGLGRLRGEEDIEWYEADPGESRSLQSNLVHCLAQVDQDVLWAGTRLGIHQFSIAPPKFHDLTSLYQETACGQIILGMAEDSDGNVWVGSRQGMMFLYITGDRDLWKGTCHTPATAPGMPDNYVINITSDQQGNVWAAFRQNGFARMTRNGATLSFDTDFPNTFEALNFDGVNQIYQDKNGEYWIATRGMGLMQFDPDTDDATLFDEQNGLSHPYIFRVFEDSRHRLWACTASGGLCRFDRNSRQFQCYVADRTDPSSLSANMVLSLSEDSQGRLWACTADGLNVMGEEEGVFRHFSTTDGLPSNVIYGAVEDNQGRMWLSTNGGIVAMEIEEDDVKIDIYDNSDGLLGLEFNQHAFLGHSSGLLFFGGIEGVTVFDPSTIGTSVIPPAIALTDFLLFNESVPVGMVSEPKGFVLDSAINEIDQIKLGYHENVIGFQFAALGSIEESPSYAYKMEGLDQDWIRSGQRQFVGYPKLPPGSYSFKVTTVAGDSLYLASTKSIDVFVARPPWTRWWAWISYVLVAGGLLYAYVRFKVTQARRIERARESERDAFRQRMARDFHDEAGNKITKLVLMTDKARRTATAQDGLNGLLGDIQSNIQDLRTGMRDFIWVLDPARDTLHDSVIRFRDFANDLCEHADIEFRLKMPEFGAKEVEMNGNTRRHFMLIFKEALNNIIKHAQADTVIFTTTQDEKVWLFTLEDNGIGFSGETKSDGHGLTNMQSRAQMIGGSVSIETAPGAGSKILLKWSQKSLASVKA